ncbi:Uncharacterised protein [Capnocytophaga canimorsus]|nr:Uncharacterised protein [Capnocytophaga canimorsus]
MNCKYMKLYEELNTFIFQKKKEAAQNLNGFLNFKW